MVRPLLWRVRVKRGIESWVEVPALTADAAMVEASKVPGVISVFAKSAIRADIVSVPLPPLGVREEESDV